MLGHESNDGSRWESGVGGCRATARVVGWRCAAVCSGWMLRGPVRSEMAAGKHTASCVAVHKFLLSFAAFGTGICLQDGRRGGCRAIRPDFAKQER